MGCYFMSICRDVQKCAQEWAGVTPEVTDVKTEGAGDRYRVHMCTGCGGDEGGGRAERSEGDGGESIRRRGVARE